VQKGERFTLNIKGQRAAHVLIDWKQSSLLRELPGPVSLRCNRGNEIGNRHGLATVHGTQPQLPARVA
jgi:hypothetical protein